MESPIADEENLVRDAYVYLTEKTYPDGCSANRKRVIRKKALKFQVSETGELLYRHKLKGKVNRQLINALSVVLEIMLTLMLFNTQGEVLLRYIESERERKMLLQACHAC